ncbi:serine/threonine protein kinase [bacterium]|jgi:Ser/Thr protein kinase RdoA (MazF antagonist)|nr:serine/threonine protein kinase [bacterium]
MEKPQATQFFFELTPDRVLDAVESGMTDSQWRCTGFCMALNSFENRVYDVELESEDALNADDADDSEKSNKVGKQRRVVKFYRPGRWTQEQILEEHQFLLDLQGSEIPVIAPLPFPDGSTLRKTGEGIWYALFPKVGGRSPDELDRDQLLRIGRLLARIHQVGANRDAPHRMRLNPTTYGTNNLRYLLDGNVVHPDYRDRYKAAAEGIFTAIEPWFTNLSVHRLHGDNHLNNLLWNQQGPFFLDFDDMVVGPPVQDFWLMIPGRFGQSPETPEEIEAKSKFEDLLEGYEQLRAFPRATLKLIEPLRALRFIHYTAWLAKRWEDPAFPAAFPQFGTQRYWNDMTEDLEEQWGLINGLRGTDADQGY